MVISVIPRNSIRIVLFAIRGLLPPIELSISPLSYHHIEAATKSALYFPSEKGRSYHRPWQ